MGIIVGGLNFWYALWILFVVLCLGIMVINKGEPRAATVT